MIDDTDPGPEEEFVSLEESADHQAHRDRDGVESLRDTQAEAGDEDEVNDTYDIDEREARELGVHLDGRMETEPRLD